MQSAVTKCKGWFSPQCLAVATAFHRLWHQYALSPSVHCLIVASVHGVFLFSVLIGKTWKEIRLRRCLRPGKSAQPVALGAVYRGAFLGSSFLCLAYSSALVWLTVHARENGWILSAKMHVCTRLSQALAWFVMALMCTCAKSEGRMVFPCALRIWWASSSILSALSFGIIITQPTKHELGAWVDAIALPVCTFLCVISIHGTTGLRVCALEGLEEPLLNVCSEMSVGKKLRNNLSSYATAGLFSLMTFSWLDPLLAFGYKKPLQLEDVPDLAQADQALAAVELFRSNWGKKSLCECIFLSLWKAAAWNGCLAGVYTCASYVGPYLIDDFVEYLGGRRRFAQEGYVLASVFLLSKFIETIAQRQWFFGIQQLGLRASAALTAMVYRKGLSLSNQSRCSHTSGEIINYISVDVQRLREFAWYLHEVWLLPLQICLAFTILFKNVGIASLAALAATSFTLLGNFPLSTLLKKFQNNIMESKDARMRATAEVLKSMRILKLQAWELQYMKKLEDLRKVECQWLCRFLYSQATIGALFWSTPPMVAVVTFSACMFIGVPLTAGRVLSALATFRILQDPIYGIPDFITMLAQTRVSLERIQSFLLEPEIDEHAIERGCAQDSEMAIEFKDDPCFSWDGIPEKPTISLSEFGIQKGLKVAVCGMVGSGKSSLLSCILGEVPKLHGSIKVNGSRAYVAQSAWMQTGKIQDNILFGKVMNISKYDWVLKVCALERDLDLFAHGDQTVIGERGINLSGGQKQRIQLARALYQDSDIYLLDDPFSAVDAHTGSHLFKEYILEALKSKTVIYVTHQVEFLPAADLILVLEGGKVVQHGKFNELLQVGTNFSRLVGAHAKALESIDLAQLSQRHDDDDTQKATQDIGSRQARKEEEVDHKSARQIIQEEERQTGQVSLAVYWSLVTAVYRGVLAPVILLAQVFFQIFQIASNYWMTWAVPGTFEEHPKHDGYVVLLVFVGLSAASSLSMFARNFLLSTVALKTAQTFFMGMLQSIFRAPMSFFDSTPTGRILNRASTDQTALDQDVCNRLAGLGFNVIYLLGIIGVMSQVAWPVFALFVPMMVLSIWLQRYYIESARELSRLASIHKSPIIHHFGESITGVATIRAFDQESRYMDANLELINCFSRPLFYNFAAMEWLTLRLNILASTIFASALLLAISLPKDTVDPSIAGLSVTYGLNLTFLLSMVVWNLSNLERQIISVERVQQYSQIASEAPLVLENARPPADWPCEGTIAFENLQVRYASYMPMVLRGVTCTFWGGKKVGVVGRTGSGKSTLIQALFRIVEPTAGKILIDGINICSIGLHDLRSNLGIIPQDPTMFEGTIRSNLDPLEEHTDAEIWEALEKSQLGHIVRAKEKKLDAPVSENGENWSVGQRQLVCLGRALLKHTRILVLDEATASVDTATDGIIQDTIHAEFAACTVITIAHRIPTVIDSNWVLLLSDGRIAEYDSPARLLQNKDSLFGKLVSEYKTR